MAEGRGPDYMGEPGSFDKTMEIKGAAGAAATSVKPMGQPKDRNPVATQDLERESLAERYTNRHGG